MDKLTHIKLDELVAVGNEQRGFIVNEILREKNRTRSPFGDLVNHENLASRRNRTQVILTRLGIVGADHKYKARTRNSEVINNPRNHRLTTDWN